MNRTAYKNQHCREHYDRIYLTIPKGEKEKIKAAASALGMSVNEYLYALVCDDLAAGESRLGKKKQGFNEDDRKYYDMIEDLSYTKDEGYFIYLKAGYINDVTGSRNIHCEMTAEVRRIIGKTHKK